MNIFYAPDVAGATYRLGEQESRHCVRVLRVRVGDQVGLVDGRGTFFEARVEQADARDCVLAIVKKHENWGARDYELTMAVAPTKNSDRYEWLLEKGTEVGVDAFVPLLTRRSERRTLNADRARRIIVSAMKQSQKAFLPLLEPPTDFVALVERPFDGVKLIAHCAEEGERLYIADCIRGARRVLVLIGPEGDFTPDEVALALSHGFQPISLGTSRLRTETAALAATVEVAVAMRDSK